jgi:hypothetical protein
MSEASLTAVNRPSPLSLLLDLTRRLAEEFHTVPIPMVTRVVKSAAEATGCSATTSPRRSAPSSRSPGRTSPPSGTRPSSRRPSR